MINLTPNECRVLGVLVEKAQTVPGQYPMTLNGLVTGCNQKNNRYPETNLDETAVMDALDSLRQKGLATLVDMSGSRVSKFRHNAREKLGVETSQLVVLAELFLRGPQTLGELRIHASRMFPLESLEIATNVLQTLMQREEPYVKVVPPAPGSRAERYVQLLCPNLHRIDVAGPGEMAAPPPAAAPAAPDPVLAERVTQLEERVATLTRALRDLAAKLGESDLLSGL